MPEDVLKLLLIEDNPADARLIEIYLSDIKKQQFLIKNLPTFNEGMQEAIKNHYDLILLDLSLPDSFGINTIQNATDLVPLTPIIVLTGRDDDEFALEVVKSGAQDYLVKGNFDGLLLYRTIRYSIKRKELEADLKRANKQIEESEQKLNTIISSSISGILVIGKGHKIVFVNPAAEKILNSPKEKLLGETFDYSFDFAGANLLSPENSDMQLEILAVETTWGNEPSILLTLHDITDLKKAEESLKKKNDELTKINKALDRFVYIISHDLKKPTANIIGLLSLYEKDVSNNNPSKGKLIYDKLSFSAYQLKQMIDDLLDQTKREISTDLSFELIDFKKIFKEVCTAIGHLIEKEKADIQTDFSGSHIIYYSYQDLKSILSNLISNAIKYHAVDKIPEIKIKTEKTPKGTLLSISDNGIGIDLKANKDKLFGKYQRFTNQSEGTGLGLWIVKETVEKNGGHLEIESQLNIGTTFKIYL